MIDFRDWDVEHLISMDGKQTSECQFSIFSYLARAAFLFFLGFILIDYLLLKGYCMPLLPNSVQQALQG